jgi:hypothetical protein
MQLSSIFSYKTFAAALGLGFMSMLMSCDNQTSSRTTTQYDRDTSASAQQARDEQATGEGPQTSSNPNDGPHMSRGVGSAVGTAVGSGESTFSDTTGGQTPIRQEGSGADQSTHGPAGDPGGTPVDAQGRPVRP